MIKGCASKTKAQLIKELQELQQQVTDLNDSNDIAYKLKASEVRYRRLFETAQDGILILDAATSQIVDVNPFLIDMLGYSKEEFIGKRLWEIGPFKDIEASQEAFKELQSRKYVRYEHLPLETKTGHQISVEFVSNIYPINGDRVIQCNIRDITERKHTEEALATARNELETRVKERTSQLVKANEELVQEINERKRIERELKESEGRFQALTENTSDVVWEMDTRGVYTYVNPKVEDLLGYTPEEIVGKTQFDLMSEEERAHIVKEFRAIIRSRKPFVRLEKTSLHKDGRSIMLETSGVPFFYADGCLGGYRGIDRDITERKKSEEELQKALKLESISTLAGGIAHDFNNLLTGILGNIALAERYTKKGGKIYDRLVDAERASLRAKDLTQQLLTFSGGGAPIKKPASIAILLKESANFVLSGSNVKCNFYLPDDLWAVEVDKEQMSRVIANIVINADQAMPQGGIISIRAENMVIKRRGYLPLSKGNYLKIAIKDNGTGIPKQHLSRIFEPYFTTKQKGSGLGLAIAYSIIKNHGGYITAESKLGVGTTIDIYVPATTEPVSFVEEIADEVYNGGRGRILVMDDEEMIRNLLYNGLSEVGYGVELAANGTEAIEKYAKAEKSGEHFDAVILDLTIPGGMGGKETIKKLLKIDPNLKAIASSGYANDKVMANFKKYGFRSVISKPYSVTELEKLLRIVVDVPESEKVAQKSREAQENSGTEKTRILVMDDAQVVITALAENLPDLGYEVEFARNGDEAISMYKKALESKPSFDVVLIDLNISHGLGGEETIQRLIEIEPEIRAIVTSGYPAEPAMIKPERFGFRAAIAKPYRIEELGEVLHKVVEGEN